MLQLGAEGVSLGWERFLIHSVLRVSPRIGFGMSIQSRRRETKGERWKRGRGGARWPAKLREERRAAPRAAALRGKLVLIKRW